ncbi:MAG: galactose-1-phosphate uridylyltransferase [Nitrospirae bacterium]|nr:galactose-1-phosphate uridylyltransferase [Nitrospirota bacterium]
MPELRQDPVTSRWVIIASERGRRPTDFEPAQEPERGGFCPFCPGNESTTPREIYAVRPGDGANWELRVIPNKFPVLQVEGNLDRAGDGIYDKMNGLGAHEVIIESREHNAQMADMPLEQIARVIGAYHERYIDLKRDFRFRYALIFKNQGEAAGASLYHSHSQLIALPVVPKRVQEELTGAKRHFDYKERCIFCDMLRQDLKDGARVVLENEDFVVLSPYAARFPFETWILPKAHQACFETISASQIHSFARILKNLLQRLKRVLNDPPFNYMIHTMPLQEGPNDYYHWHVEVIPKLTKVAGFEWGSGFYINPTPPEEATVFLREARVEREF